MFNKIKRDFLILNMAIISILMFLVCMYIYFSMRFSVLSSMNTQMEEIEAKYQNYYNVSRFTESLNIDAPDIETEIDEFFFIVDVSKDFAVKYYYSDDVDDLTLIQSITNVCMNLDSDKGLLKNSDEYFYFSKIHFRNASTRLIVLDVTDRMMLLHNLFANILLVGFVSLFLIFIISKFFTNRSIKPLEEAFAKQKNFISDASHELKTPLAVVKTNLDVLNKSDSLNSDDKKWLQYAYDEVNQMSKMVNEFLYLAKMDNRTEEVHFESVNFSEIVNGVLLSMEVIAFEKNILIEENVKDDIMVKGHYDELKRLIVILVDNAIKYCDDGGRIFTELKVEGNNGCFIIKNTGTVIDAKDKNIIFEKFYRANKERERSSQSYGIGLSIAKSTCDKHHFNIKAYPENNMTCFKISFKILNKV